MSEDPTYEQQLEQEINALNQTKMSTGLANANYVNNVDKNIVEFQLDTDVLLEKLERFYKGEYLGYDDNGKPEWKTPKDPELVIFNELGVNSMMEVVTKYIDKNTMLSTYSEERIYEIMADLGDELVLFLLCNYEKVGMTTYFKKTKFRITISTTLHIIESAYRRAIRGQTRTDLNQSKIVTQTDFVGNRGFGAEKKKSSAWWNPKNLI